jgi:predicted chitinase
LKNWSHPFKDKRNPLMQLTHMARAKAGFYPLGRNGLWHGGVHFDSGTVGPLDQSSVQCLADGEVVAYRIDTHSPTTPYIVNKQTVEKPFSRNFVLVRHRLQPPKIEGSPDTPPSLTFYSLYMHLRDWASYEADAALQRPAFWPERNLRVRADVSNTRVGTSTPKGLIVLTKPAEGGHMLHLDLLPPGTPVVVSGEGKYRKLEHSRGPASLCNADGSLQGYVAFRNLEHVSGATYRVSSSGDHTNVRSRFDLNGRDLLILRQGTEITISGEGEFRKLESISQYVLAASLQGEPAALTDQVVVLDHPLPIKAGNLIGHIGRYHECRAEHPEEKLHLEVFSGDDVDIFIEASRAWAKRLPDKDKTWLKLAKGTAVVTHEDNPTAARLQMASASSPLSAADLLLPKSVLDALPADRKIQVPASPSHNARTWYRLDGLLHDADNNLLDGWVREEVGVTPWLSPWSWEGYDIIYDYGTPRHALASFFSNIRQFNETQLERYRPMADAEDKGPVKSRLFDIIDRNRDGKMTAEELQAAISLPAHAQSISQLIIHKESEWYHQSQKWDALDELLGHSGSTPHLNWLAEKQRIKQISWWSEMAEKVGLPSWGKVFHFHPVGLQGVFTGKTFEFTLDVMRRIYERLGSARNSDLREIADELNANIDFFKLDTPLRRTHFFAQILQETGDNLAVEEDFSYEANALISLFNHFRNNPEEARRHGYKTRKGKIKENGTPMSQADYKAIANGAYGGRNELGNRGVSSGDGWKYRGRGLKQLTGLHNYTLFQKWHLKSTAQWPNENQNFVDNPDLLLRMKYATRSAVSFWLSNKLYEIADKGNSPEIVDLITAIINKRTDSYPQRRENFIRLSLTGVLR